MNADSRTAGAFLGVALAVLEPAAAVAFESHDACVSESLTLCAAKTPDSADKPDVEAQMPLVDPVVSQIIPSSLSGRGGARASGIGNLTTSR
jgi:hypothetical protein